MTTPDQPRILQTGTVYQHYKNRQYYLVTDTDIVDSETGDRRVTYKALYGNHQKHSHTETDFLREVVNAEGEIVYRFSGVEGEIKTYGSSLSAGLCFVPARKEPTK
jgi:hypothetical protein